MHPTLSEILTTRFDVPEDILSEAYNSLAEKGGDLGEYLLRRGALEETALLQAYSDRFDLPFLPDLPFADYDATFTKTVPIQFLKRYSMVPLVRPAGHAGEGEEISGQAGEEQGAEALIAINGPGSLPAVDDLVRLLALDRYRVVFSTRAAIHSAINIAYEFSRDSAEQLMQDLEEGNSIVIGETGTADLLDDTSDAPMIRLVNQIISQAVKARASDIHIEPYQDSLKVRYRVDGILYDSLTPPKWIQPALLSRVKVMANLNIAERRLPQDGRMDIRIGDQDVDVRVSTLPTSYGERIVLRLLNKTASLIGLSELGLEDAQLSMLKRQVAAPNGIILVTGPTGSGKTTTLYAVLSSLNSPDINIITIEDPVEYQLAGINQIQVNPKIELTFAKGLRSIVRQDPDVILVGEIRDAETAEIAVQSALTGHLVFSTLHTNDSASAVTRLVDIGVEPFLLSSSLLAVVAQRLVRVLCPHCREGYRPDAVMIAQLGVEPGSVVGWRFNRSVGCTECFQTGYRGRLGIFEIMELDDALKSLILQTYDSTRIKKNAVKSGMVTLRQDGLEKIRKGVTTVEEVLRATQR
ncbi:MAG: type II secretion system ATPase GspE [Desulfobacteraceae bacterium]|nr:type II secretion system ATPase GspE [Desulfobacteraceae bacterium]